MHFHKIKSRRPDGDRSVLLSLSRPVIAFPLSSTRNFLLTALAAAECSSRVKHFATTACTVLQKRDREEFKSERTLIIHSTNAVDHQCVHVRRLNGPSELF